MVPSVDTIVALSTPPGRSGIGVIRLSGPSALQIAQTLTGEPSFSQKPNHARLRKIYHPETLALLDEALITYFRGPQSYTGEDVIELSCHGSPVLLRSLVDIILRLNARVADPGEFTLRALAHGKIDLTQAEAIRDLINAQTNAAVQQATRQMRGEVSHVLRPLRDRLLDVIVRLESSLEFVEEDLPAIEFEQLQAEVESVCLELEELASSFTTGRLLSDGIRVTFWGRPNVGKSSLFNVLLSFERAIVTDVPGTTRDTLSEAIDVEGIAVHLTDTAGVREVNDPIESIGVQRARRAIADADLTILVIDGSEDLTAADRALLDESEGSARLIALNKKDLPTFAVDRFQHNHKSGGPLSFIPVSAKTKAGLDDLRAAMLAHFRNGQTNIDGLLITNARHYDLLRRAIESLRSSGDLLVERASEELVLVGLHNALRYLGEILGEITPDDILAQIFSTFCIGK